MKIFRILFLSICLIIYSKNIQAQQGYIDVIYLKNGSVIKGKIIEQIPNQSFKIKLEEGKIIEFTKNEIATIKKEVLGSNINSETPLYLGFQTGINLSNYAWYNNGPSKKVGTRFQFAVVLNKKFENGLELQPEIQYSQQGYLEEYSSPSYSSSSFSYSKNIISEYINIPVLLKRNFNLSNNTKLFLSLGPYLGYWINNTIEYSETENGKTTSGKTYISEKNWENLNRTQFGGALGYGLSYTLANRGIIYFDNRVSYGFTKLFKNVTIDNNPHDIFMGFSLGYMLEL
jgi:hypothetical protein